MNRSVEDAQREEYAMQNHEEEQRQEAYRQYCEEMHYRGEQTADCTLDELESIMTARREGWLIAMDSVTDETVCELINICVSKLSKPFYEKLEENYSTSFEALREKQARENPQPLTLEQLRERDGKPVWFESGGIKKWIIAEIKAERFYTEKNEFFFLDDYVRWFTAYDYPPKEQTL